MGWLDSLHHRVYPHLSILWVNLRVLTRVNLKVCNDACAHPSLANR